MNIIGSGLIQHLTRAVITGNDSFYKLGVELEDEGRSIDENGSGRKGHDIDIHDAWLTALGPCTISVRFLYDFCTES